MRVVSQADFAAWVKEREAAAAAAPATRRAALFAERRLRRLPRVHAGGHDRRRSARTSTTSSSAAQKAGQDPADYVREAIVDPGKVIAPGYQDGVMPPSYGETLTPAEIDALVAYLTGAK